MVHGRGLNVVVLEHFKRQTQILLSKKKLTRVVTRGIVQILLTFLTSLLKPIRIRIKNAYSGAYSLDHYSGASESFCSAEATLQGNTKVIHEYKLGA